MTSTIHVDTADNPSDELIRIRAEEFPSLEPGRIFFNTAGGAPLCRSARVAATGVLEDMAREGDRNFMQYLVDVQRTRRQIATYIGAGHETEIAFTVNSSSSTHLLARMLRAAGVERVFCPRYEFPTSTQALHALGLAVVFFGDEQPGTLPSNLEAPLDEAIRKAGTDDKKSALLASQVNYLTGERIDLSAAGTACKARDMLCCINATQAFGTLPISVEGHIDMLFGTGLKWAHAGFGTGFLYIRNSLIAEFGLPKLSGWTSVENPGLMDNRTHLPVPTTKSLDMGGGAPPFQNILALFGALSFRERVGGGDLRLGIRRIEQWCLLSATHLRERFEAAGLKPLCDGKPQQSGIVSIEHEKAKEIGRALEARGIYTTLRRHPGTGNETVLRFGVPFFTLDEEVEGAANALGEILQDLCKTTSIRRQRRSE